MALLILGLSIASACSCTIVVNLLPLLLIYCGSVRSLVHCKLGAAMHFFSPSLLTTIINILRACLHNLYCCSKNVLTLCHFWYLCSSIGLHKENKSYIDRKELLLDDWWWSHSFGAFEHNICICLAMKFGKDLLLLVGPYYDVTNSKHKATYDA